MKRLTIFILISVLLFCGCGKQSVAESDSVTFYYLQKEYQYGQQNSVIAPERRAHTSHRRDLSYMLALYLMGPVDDSYVVPLPSGTRIYHTELDERTVQLELSDAARDLSDAEFTLVAACLSKTCFNITDAEKIVIVSGERSVSITPDNLTIYDDSSASPETTEEST